MGLLGGDSESSSSQTTKISSANQQGISGLSTANGGKTLYKYLDNINGGSVGKANNQGTLVDPKNKAKATFGGTAISRTVIKNANSGELAKVAANISLGALDYYDRQNQRSTALLEQVALATTQSNRDVINEFANITEKAGQSEALTMNEQLLKYGVVALIGFYILKGSKRA